jgi:hypothetical protein
LSEEYFNIAKTRIESLNERIKNEWIFKREIIWHKIK